MSTECVICQRPMAETAYADSACAAQAAEKLRAIADLAPEARQVAYGLTRGSQGAASGKPGSRSPGNDDALDALGEITWGTLPGVDPHRAGIIPTALAIADTRGLHSVSAALRSPTHPDPLALAAKWLTGQTEWLRHATDAKGDPWALTAFRDFGEAASKLRLIVDGPSAKKYLGPCGAVQIGYAAELDPVLGTAVVSEVESPPCEGDVYGRAGAKTGTCRTCKTEYDQAERQIWLTQQVRSSDLAWTARGIADALGINVKTLRAWATDRYSGDVLIRRAKLSTYWRDEQGRLVPWSEVARGERLHYVGDVKALAEQAADRRAAREAAEAERIDA